MFNYHKMINQNFQFFVAMNAPFAATDVHLAPLSDVDDGTNDLIMLRGQFGGHCRMARMLTSMETGQFFTERGEIRRDLPIDYVKANCWELRPTVKVPEPEMSALDEASRIGDNSMLSDIEAQVAANRASKQVSFTRNNHLSFGIGGPGGDPNGPSEIHAGVQ